MTSLIYLESMQEVFHYPVMHKEVLSYLEPQRCKSVLDCTVGTGSHALKILELLPQGARLIGIDKDRSSLEIAKKRLSVFGERVILVKEDFVHLDEVLEDLGIDKIEAIFFDLGISMYQLSDARRGFSFLQEGPLDMRIDNCAFLSAYDLINNLSEKELGDIFKKFGEERYSQRIAHLIEERRRKVPINTTRDLLEIILKALPINFKYKVQTAARIFQALRIAVNQELELLRQVLEKAPFFLNPGGRLLVISFHSLEDRIVKQTFKRYASENLLKIITKKPVIAQETELKENSASRSARLRVAERI